MVDIGDSGRQNDGRVFSNCSLGYAIKNNKLNFPDPENIGNSEKILSYVLVSDDGFGLKKYMIKPHHNKNIPLDQKISNYRLSRARRFIENTFGIGTTRFRIFRRPIIANLDKVILTTQAIEALRNFLMKKRSANNYHYCPTN